MVLPVSRPHPRRSDRHPKVRRAVPSQLSAKGQLPAVLAGWILMNIGSSTPPQPLMLSKECFSIKDVRTLVARQLRVDIEFVTSETHFTNDLGADLLDRVELMLAIEDKFAGVEITETMPSRYKLSPI
jgi:acyl carrier protein